MCESAKLLALLAYGRVSLNAQGCLHWEVNKMVDEAKKSGVQIDISALRAWAEKEVERAGRLKVSMEEAFELHVPDDLLLVTSPPIINELLELAQENQDRQHPDVQPDRVVRHIARHTFVALEELGPAPAYLSKGRVSKHDYLIHTAMEARADILITNDEDLLLAGDLSYQSSKTGHSVRPYSQEDFVADMPSNLDLSKIDPYAALRAAVAADSVSDWTAVSD
jgi:predicted nucleic acid-binding protein